MPPTLTTPPGSVEPYKLPCYTGELWTVPTSNSTLRLLVTAKETNDAFAVVTCGGTYDKPIGFHYHREAHDVFLCLKGKLNVWANDKARSLEEGDYADVPPVSLSLSLCQKVLLRNVLVFGRYFRFSDEEKCIYEE